jgi:16S rRNA (adenine1518-N6/adenine1519-N6)-dimethyltransferase
VKPSAFHPPPKVDSSVVLLEGREPLVRDPEAFLEFAALCFRQKRKTIRNNLREAYGTDVDFWPEAALRAEQIPIGGLIEMFQRTVTQRHG